MQWFKRRHAMRRFKRRQTTPGATQTEPQNRVPYTARCTRCHKTETETTRRYFILCRSCLADVKRYADGT